MQNAVLLLPFIVYFMHFDEVFVGKKGHRSIREIRPADCRFSSTIGLCSERECADWLRVGAPDVMPSAATCCLVRVNNVTCSACDTVKAIDCLSLA